MDDPARVGTSGRLPLLMAGILALAISALALVACEDDKKTTGGDPTSAATEDGGGDLSGTVEGDGSSTVYPITEAVIEEFAKVETNVDVLAGIAGTSGGFERFCAGETDFNDASRPIKEEEITACADAGITYQEFEVAFDGLSVVVNPAIDFIPNDCLTLAQLKTIWEPAAQETVTNWNQVDPSFPDRELTLYGPGTDSGTFDYFTDTINGEEGASRGDYTASEDDNTLVQGVAGDDNALGYFGYAYYEQNQDQLKVLGVDGGSGCVAPSPDTIRDGSYAPLSRPLFVYVTDEALQRPEVVAFIRFYLTEGPALAEEVGYVASPDASYEEGLALLP